MQEASIKSVRRNADQLTPITSAGFIGAVAGVGRWVASAISERRMFTSLPLILVMMVLTGHWTSLAVTGDSPSQCLLQPDHVQMRLPRRGFTWLDGEEIGSACGEAPARRWIRKSSGSADLFVYANGPSGSGRYWNVTIGVVRGKQARPVRGVCLRTSTVGWRTLQKYKKAPLPWLDDLDKDGKTELIIWSSFPLRQDASLAEYGLMAWVYRVDSENSLAIDWELSRRMARELAAEYRLSPGSTTSQTAPLRIEAGVALEQFADERCSVPAKDAR